MTNHILSPTSAPVEELKDDSRFVDWLSVANDFEQSLERLVESLGIAEEALHMDNEDDEVRRTLRPDSIHAEFAGGFGFHAQVAVADVLSELEISVDALETLSKELEEIIDQLETGSRCENYARETLVRVEAHCRTVQDLAQRLEWFVDHEPLERTIRRDIRAACWRVRSGLSGDSSHSLLRYIAIAVQRLTSDQTIKRIIDENWPRLEARLLAFERASRSLERVLRDSGVIGAAAAWPSISASMRELEPLLRDAMERNQKDLAELLGSRASALDAASTQLRQLAAQDETTNALFQEAAKNCEALAAVAQKLREDCGREMTFFPATLALQELSWYETNEGTHATYELLSIPESATRLQLFARDRRGRPIGGAVYEQAGRLSPGQWIEFEVNVSRDEVASVRIQALD